MTRTRFLSVFLICLAVYLLTSAGRLRVIDEYMVYFQTESLVTRASLSVPQAVDLCVWYGRAGKDGEPYSPYAPLQALALSPGFLLGQLLIAAPGVPESAKDLVLAWSVVSWNAFFGALTCAVFFAFLVRLGVDVGVASVAALGVAFSTLLWPISGTLFSEPIAALLLLGAAFALADPSGSPRIQGALISGLLLGGALLLRPSHIVAVPVFCLSLLFARGGLRGRLKSAVALGAVTIAAGALYLCYNTYLYGEAFEFGYPEQVEGGKRLNDFDTPVLTGMFGFLLSPGKSLFLFAPLTVFALWGLPQLCRERPTLAVIAVGTPFAYLLFFSTYTQWEGGYCYGPRYLIPVLPLLLLAMAPLLRTPSPARRRAFFLCIVIGVMVQVPGVFTSFLEEQRGSGSYYDAGFNYRLGYPSVWAQLTLLGHYLMEAFRGKALASPLGTGIDVSAVFLAKGGVSAWTLAVFNAAMAMIGIVGGWLMLRDRTAKALSENN